MSLQCGIVGLPNVGKSTLFNALSNAEIDAENYPFCTIEPNVGIVAVPDKRLDQIIGLVRPKNSIPTTVKFVDIAGLVSGASKGEGLGNKFLAHIRETQAIIHVVRCHGDEDVIHVDGKVDPISDIGTIDTELSLADLDSLEKAITKAAKESKTGDKVANKKLAMLNQLHDLVAKYPLRRHVLEAELLDLAKAMSLLTIKPIIYVANTSESMSDNEMENLAKVESFAKNENSVVLSVCAKLEAEISTLSLEDKKSFLAEMGLDESGLDKVIRAGYQALNLITYFTAGEKEVRAWTVKRDACADEAAGVIHTDFQKGFIRAEVIGYADFIENKGEKGSKEAGVWRLEGRDYLVQDGDVMLFRFNV